MGDTLADLASGALAQPNGTETLLLVEIALLGLILTQLSRLETRLRPVLAAAGPTSPRAQPSRPTSPRKPRQISSNPPTMETLLPDAAKKDFGPVEEWSPLTTEELDVARRVRLWLGAERFDKVPYDLLVTFIRGYAYRTDWAESTFVYLERALKWRSENGIDGILCNTPAKRETFEAVCPSGPVGFDADGHMVICERLGRTDVTRLFAHFDEDQYITHQAFSREVVRAYCTANSIRRQKRLYKVVVLLDMKSMGMAHVSKRLMSIVKTVNSLFGWYYPETVHKFYVINAPLVFRTAWSIIRPLVHPITAAKFHILGPDWRTRVRAAGIQIKGGDLPDSLPSWSAEAQRLIQEYSGPVLDAGWMPPDDLKAMAELDRF